MCVGVLGAVTVAGSGVKNEGWGWGSSTASAAKCWGILVDQAPIIPRLVNANPNHAAPSTRHLGGSGATISPIIILQVCARLMPKLLKVKGIGRRGFNRSAHAVDAQRYGIAQDEIDSLPRRLLAAPPTQRAESHDDDRRSERRASVTTK